MKIALIGGCGRRRAGRIGKPPTYSAKVYRGILAGTIMPYKKEYQTKHI